LGPARRARSVCRIWTARRPAGRNWKIGATDNAEPEGPAWGAGSRRLIFIMALSVARVQIHT
jgi:hypothetical protein